MTNPDLNLDSLKTEMRVAAERAVRAAIADYMKSHDPPIKGIVADITDIAADRAAEATLTAAQARIALFEAALRPFVEWSKNDLATADKLQADLMRYDDDCEVNLSEFEGNGTHPLLWGDLRRAARALGDTK
ncbi:MAG: hypothetical protein KGL39_60160 [Patescibacteria group bacterium]|nr:hypothetical protein [Patescibacteria group bacterium]